jgi:hypothetical protein
MGIFQPRDVERGPVDEEGRLISFAPSWTARDLSLDPWSYLSHKAIVGPGSRDSIGSSLAPSWVGAHARRLNAYRVYLSYLMNVSRAFLPAGRDPGEVAKFREYGDAAVIRDMIRVSVLGENPEISVDGADAEPEMPEEPVEPGDDATPEERSAYVEARRQYDDNVRAHEQAMRDYERAKTLQEFIDEWADRVKLPLKMVAAENNACGLGDGVYYLTWSNRKKRVLLTTFEPGFYFPVLSTAPDDEDYPTRVHLAWEEVDQADESKRWVVRWTFELVPIGSNGETKNYPYAPDEPSEYRCEMTAARWRWDDLGDRRVDDLDDRGAEFLRNADGIEMNRFDLGIDFIPIVHVPNTITEHHYGESVLARIAQLLDDLGQNDTDLATTADLAGAPPLAVKGRQVPGALTSYGPGTVFFGDGVDVVDTSHSLDALLKRGAELLERMSVNGRVPKEVLGRVKMSEVPSGVALLLSFGPFRALVNEMRLIRAHKYALLFSMVQRLAIVGGVRKAEDGVITTRIKFGSYLPTDTDGLVKMIIELLRAGGVSRATALKILRDGGLDLDDDLKAELERIEHEDFEGARALAEALSNEEVAAEYLGRDLPEEVVPAAPGAPLPAPNGQGAVEPVPAGPPNAQG